MQCAMRTHYNQHGQQYAAIAPFVLSHTEVRVMIPALSISFATLFAHVDVV